MVKSKNGFVQVDTIDNIPVYYYKGSLYIKKDGAFITARDLSKLKLKLKNMDFKTKDIEKVIYFDAYVGGRHYSEFSFGVFDMTDFSRSSAHIIDKNGNRDSVDIDDVYIYTKELETELNKVYIRAKDLKDDIESILENAKKVADVIKEQKKERDRM